MITATVIAVPFVPLFFMFVISLFAGRRSRVSDDQIDAARTPAE